MPIEQQPKEQNKLKSNLSKLSKVCSEYKIIKMKETLQNMMRFLTCTYIHVNTFACKQLIHSKQIV